MSDIIPTLNVKNWMKGLSLPIIGLFFLELVIVIFTLIEENFPGRNEQTYGGFRYYVQNLFFGSIYGALSILFIFGLWLGYSIINFEGNFGDAAILGLIFGLIFGLTHIILFNIIFPVSTEPDVVIGAGFKSSTK
ncbi:MAG: hypothetical protein ACXAC7_23180 [Candidatus Hodarchaeales archaeon]|jgi:hypothetical protein